LTDLVSNAVATREFEGLILRIALNYHFN